MPTPQRARCLFISPHYDDVALSCAALINTLSDLTVLTVFGGSPGGNDSGYNYKTTGEISTNKQIAIRRAEDFEALCSIGANQAYLDLLDSCYSRPESYTTDLVAQRLAEYLKVNSFDIIYFPLGLHHADHILASDAVLHLRRERADYAYIMYEDLPYSYSKVLERTERLKSHKNIIDRSIKLDVFDSSKVDLIKLYVSQYKAIAVKPMFLEAMRGKEIYWPLVGHLDSE